MAVKDATQNIQVFVRCRPLKQNENPSGVQVLQEKGEIKISDRPLNHPSDRKTFNFDRVFGSESKQTEVYDDVVRPLIDQVLLGFNCTVFAYGQTATGKTYTMEGFISDDNSHWEDDPRSGIIPRSVTQLFRTLKDSGNEFTVRVSFLELYNEDTFDLLGAPDDTTKLKIFDDANKKGSVIVGGLEEIIVQTKDEIYDILRKGSKKRQTGTTLMNDRSSRSHTIFTITIHTRESSVDGEELLKIGKLNLVDLAGSENIGRSGAQDKRAREAGNINQSLLTLGRVITALVEKRPHIPYRESKLTRLLQDSLGGKTKTSIIATISPGIKDIEDTLSTLDYASRAKKITNKPEMNQRLTKKALLKELGQEIERLRRDLQASRDKNGVYLDQENYNELCKKVSLGETAKQDMEDRLAAYQNELEKSKKILTDYSAGLIEKQSERICGKRDDLIAQSKKILAEAQQYRCLAKECKLQSKTLLTYLENRTRLAEESNNLSGILRNSGRMFNMVNQQLEHCDQRERSSLQQVGLADLLYKESVELKALECDIKNQSDNFIKQAQHYEFLAENCKKQLDSLISAAFDNLAQDTRNEVETLKRSLSGVVQPNSSLITSPINSNTDTNSLHSGPLSSEPKKLCIRNS